MTTMIQTKFERMKHQIALPVTRPEFWPPVSMLTARITQSLGLDTAFRGSASQAPVGRPDSPDQMMEATGKRRAHAGAAVPGGMCAGRSKRNLPLSSRLVAPAAATPAQPISDCRGNSRDAPKD